MSAEETIREGRNLLEVERLYLNMGPQHPSTHGVLRLGLLMEGERVIEIDPDIGYLHRGIEKIAEKRTYLQFIPLTDRIDYVSAMANNFGYVLAVEKLLEIEIPRRADYLRVIMAEFQRIANHLVWLGAFGLDLGAVTPMLYGFREREDILDLYEMTCGARLTYNYYRFGGVSRDIPPAFVPAAKKFLSTFGKKIDEYEELLTENEIFLRRTKNVGILSKEDALSYAACGPVLRASGIKWDLRKDRPHSIYPEFEFDIPVGENGDCWDRFKVRIEEMRQSKRILDAAIDGIPEGDFIAPKLPRTVRPKKGEAYGSVETPKGELGFFVVSDGGTNPVRVKVRAPSFVNLACVPAMARGCLIADVVAILGSIDFVLGDVDR